MTKFNKLVFQVTAFFLCVARITGCAKNTAINQAEKTEKGCPTISEAKAIAEVRFTFSLPTVLNYAVMYQVFLDETFSQFKAPVNTISNEPRVTPKDTATVTPSSDTPCSMLPIL